jgi:hypothetical protein
MELLKSYALTMIRDSDDFDAVSIEGVWSKEIRIKLQEKTEQVTAEFVAVDGLEENLKGENQI